MIECVCGHDIPEEDPAGNKFPESLLNIMVKRHERIEHRNSIYTIDEMVEKMLDEMSDYPVLGKIAVNPSGDDVWKLDR